jgi:transposase InsO family protein
MYTDLATRMVYPVFTKDRSAEELCAKSEIFFNAHPEWKNTGSGTEPRFIRHDPERNYMSNEFRAFAYKHDYMLEETPPRDKHANGVAERSVGLISLKANVAMLSPTPSVPLQYWDLAMEYACRTQGFNYSSTLGTSPYHFITGKHVNVHHLHPFWASCYVHIPLKNGWAKSGFPALIRPVL